MVNPTPGYDITTPYWKRGPYWSTDRDSRGWGRHTGADLAGGKAGTPIVSATPGRVIAANSYDRSYGYKTIIRWGNFDLWYCHMPSGAARVKVGQIVTAGQRIGTIGSTGNVTGAHLHLEMRVAGGGFAEDNFRNPILAINYAVSNVAKWGQPDTWKIGATGPDVTRLGQRLVVWAKAYSIKVPYAQGPGPLFTEVDQDFVKEFQKKQGWSEADADGYPGPETFKRLAANPVPEAPEFKSFSARFMTINVNAQRLGSTNTYGHASFVKGKSYAVRVKLVAGLQDKGRASFVLTQEQGTNAQALQQARPFPDHFRHFNHGDNRGDIRQAIHYGSSARKLLHEGFFEIGGGRQETYGVFEDIKTGIEFFVGNFHPDYVRSADSKRQSQFRSGIDQGLSRYPDLAHLIGGDFNDDKDDTFDGPGRAFTAAGFKDTEDTASVKINSEFGTLNGLTPGLQAGRRYDRFAYRDGKHVAVSCNSIETLDGYPASDHNPVVVSIKFTEK